MYAASNENIQLVSTPSSINNNLSLIGGDENTNPQLLSVIHEGFVNIIPLNSDSSATAHYVPLLSGRQRGHGKIKEVKWFNIRGGSYLVILSNFGLKIYQADNYKAVFHHACLEHGDGQGYAQGVCCVNLTYLCVGSSMGTIWVFKHIDNSNFAFINRHFAHSGPVLCLAGNENYCISSGLDKQVCVWTVQQGLLNKFRELTIEGLNSCSTSIIFSNYTIICGYESGEVAIFDLLDDTVCLRHVAHRLEISSMDFSYIKCLLLTASKDAFVKVWKLIDTKFMLLKYAKEASGPIVGAQFLNLNATEFAVASLNSVNVLCFISNDHAKNVNYLNISGVFELGESEDEEEKELNEAFNFRC